MKKLFTLLLTFTISLSLMGQQDIEELRKQRYDRKHNHSSLEFEKKMSKYPEFDARQLPRQYRSVRGTALKATQAADQTMDSILWDYYEIDNSEWVLFEKELFSYDDKGNMVTYVWGEYDDVEMKFLPIDKETVKHNAAGQPTEVIWLTWDIASSQWINSGKWEMVFDEDGMLIQETVYDWDAGGSQWLVGAQFDMTYDDGGMLLTELWYFWDEDSAKLVLTYKDEYLYESGILNTWNEYLWEEGDWGLIFRTFYYYSPEGNLIEEFTQGLTSNEEWIDYSRFLYTYDEDDNLIMEEVWDFDWSTNVMVLLWQYHYVWDADGNMTEQVDKSWVEGVKKGTNVWENTLKSEWTFNKDFTLDDLYVPYWFQDIESLTFLNMPISETGYFYANEAWVLDFKQTAYYSDFDGSTGINELEEFRVSVFPVPASENLTFSWEDQFTRLNLELYDLTGKRVISRSVDNNEAIGMGQLSGGLYLYKLSNGKALIHSGKISIK